MKMMSSVHARTLPINDSRPMHRLRSADGVLLAGDSWGDPGGIPVILLHGAGQTRHSWRRTGMMLGEAGFFAVSFDARGHGDSGWPPDANYSQLAMVRDLESIASSLGMLRPVLVGAATGGATSLLAVGEGYVDARALILVNIAPQTEPAGVARIQSSLRRGSSRFEPRDDAIHSPTALCLRPKDESINRWRWDPHFVAWPRDMGRRRQRLCASARKLTLPTMLMRGEHSDVVSDTGVAEFLRLCPHAEYVNLRDAGHASAWEGNDIYGEEAMRYIVRIAQAEGPRTRRLYDCA
ncbi:Alpha/beta hydrolase fold protein [Caballeronia pedi]|uniref:Alpha/beta hydrolase fold protein n=2 Tax=Caballeronia pedi TaxID=1777141 RepID=A0A158CYA5_9BURK|nr:Alpha/beta hydrolase fold protein [Caballeronia pedi]